MAQYGTGVSGWTPVAHADGASSLANNSYHALRTIATSTLRVTEVFIGGEATSSTVNRMSLRRASTNSATPSTSGAVVPAPLNPLSQACASTSYVTAATGPTIASTNHLMNLALNTFGGVIRVVPAPGEEVWATTATAPNSELILDSISGTGQVSTEMVFEEI